MRGGAIDYRLTDDREPGAGVDRVHAVDVVVAGLAAGQFERLVATFVSALNNVDCVLPGDRCRHRGNATASGSAAVAAFDWKTPAEAPNELLSPTAAPLHPPLETAGVRMSIPVFTSGFDPREVADAVRTYGCAVLSRIVQDELISEVVTGFDAMYPDWDELMSRRFAAGDETPLRVDSDELQQAGPFGIPALDAIPLLESVRAVIAQLLGPTALLLQSHLWAKYGQLAGEFDLPLHADFVNHMLVYPSDNPKYQIIHGIAYYSDVTDDNGATYVVSREHTKDHWLVPQFHLRSETPHLYEHEAPVLAPAGSVLLYETRVLHRVGCMRNPLSRRRTHFFAYGPAGVPWLGWGRWLNAKPGLSRRAFVEQLDAAGLAAIGFPAGDSDYWTDETIEGTRLLYPGLDFVPARLTS